MIYFYFVFLVVSSAAFTGDMILRYMENIKCFGFEKPLFKAKDGIVPVYKLLPENLTMLFVFVMVFAATGAIYTVIGMAWYIALFCALCGGATFCFFIQYFGKSAVDSVKGRKLPLGDAAADLEGVSAEDIPAGSCGKAKLIHNGIEHEVIAAAAGGDDILNGGKITALYESGGYYFVVGSDKIFREIKDIEEDQP